ncbi:MAG: RodZ domain-containing protein [Acidobacteriota bacterium]
MGEKPNLTFGEELRRERLIRDVSLEEISAATKISIRLLSALENSDISRLPAPVYSRGFIRAYSKHLGLNPEEMVNAYLADVAPEKGREAAGSRKGRPRSRFLRGRRAAAGTIVVSVTAILLVLGLIARPQRRPGVKASVAPRAIAPVSFKNVSVSPGPALAVQDPAPEQTPQVASGVSMILEFDQDSWTEVSADGQIVFSGMIRHGIRREFQARAGFRLTLGNAGGVRVTVDGRALEPLGQSGQVVRDLPLPADRQG